MKTGQFLPAAFRRFPHARTRYLYYGVKAGRLTCVFQPARRANRSVRDQTYPPFPKIYSRTHPGESRLLFALSYVLDGRGTLYDPASGMERNLEPGIMFQYNGRRANALHLAAGDDFFECSICLDGDTGQRLDELGFWNRSISILQPGLHDSLIRAYLDIYDGIVDPNLPSRGLLLQLTRLLDNIYTMALGNEQTAAFKTRAIGVLSGNLNPGFKMSEAAAMMHMPYETFRQKFRKIFGLSPIDYQVRLRIEKACLLLGQYNVRETAAMLNYADPYAFSKQFKKIMGVPPRDYDPFEGS